MINLEVNYKRKKGEKKKVRKLMNLCVVAVGQELGYKWASKFLMMDM